MLELIFNLTWKAMTGLLIGAGVIMMIAPFFDWSLEGYAVWGAGFLMLGLLALDTYLRGEV